MEIDFQFFKSTSTPLLGVYSAYLPRIPRTNLPSQYDAVITTRAMRDMLPICNRLAQIGSRPPKGWYSADNYFEQHCTYPSLRNRSSVAFDSHHTPALVPMGHRVEGITRCAMDLCGTSVLSLLSSLAAET